MVRQLNTALCKYQGGLYLIEVTKAKDGVGKCPECGYTKFREGIRWDKGWLECANPDGCGFAVLKAHVERAKERST